MAVAVLTYANRAAVARALTERGYTVSKMQVNRWAGGAEMPPIAARMILELFLHGPEMPKEAAPPEWAERLQATVDSIHARQDEIMARQGAVASGATQRLIEALAPLDRLQNSLDFLERLEEQMPLLGEGAHAESEAPGQDEATPQGR